MFAVNQTIYRIANPQDLDLRVYAGQAVIITGQLQKDMITVSTIREAPKPANNPRGRPSAEDRSSDVLQAKGPSFRKAKADDTEGYPLISSANLDRCNSLGFKTSFR